MVRKNDTEAILQRENLAYFGTETRLYIRLAVYSMFETWPHARYWNPDREIDIEKIQPVIEYTFGITDESVKRE